MQSQPTWGIAKVGCQQRPQSQQPSGPACSRIGATQFGGPVLKTNLVSSLLSLALVAYLVFGTRLMHQQWTPLRVAGMALAVVAFAGLLLSRFQLGRAFAIRARATMLVTSGIYSKVRNPIYIFGGLCFLGLAIAFHSWPLFALLGLIIPLQIARVRRERHVLEDRFGEQYRAYRRQTWL